MLGGRSAALTGQTGPMRSRLLLPALSTTVLVLAACVSQACLVLTVNPSHDRESLLWEPALVGDWHNADDNSSLVIERGEWQSYRIRYAFPIESGELTGHLTAIGKAKVSPKPAPTTWVLSNHDVTRHVTRYGGGAYCVIRPGTLCAELNLQDANLQGADLARASFLQSNLSGANLQGANLNGAQVVAVYTALNRAEWALARVAGGPGALAGKYRHPAVAPHLRALQRTFSHMEALLEL